MGEEKPEFPEGLHALEAYYLEAFSRGWRVRTDLRDWQWVITGKLGVLPALPYLVQALVSRGLVWEVQGDLIISPEGKLLSHKTNPLLPRNLRNTALEDLAELATLSGQAEALLWEFEKPRGRQYFSIYEFLAMHSLVTRGYVDTEKVGLTRKGCEIIDLMRSLRDIQVENAAD